MGLIHKLFFKKYSKEEYDQLLEIHKEETKSLRKRPQFIIGLLCLGGLEFYFLWKMFFKEAFDIEHCIYFIVLLIGFISLNDSIREYFCERLFQEQEKRKGEK